MQVLALPSDRSVSELAPLLADWDSLKFLALLRSLAGQATAARCVAGSLSWGRQACHPTMALLMIVYLPAAVVICVSYLGARNAVCAA